MTTSTPTLTPVAQPVRTVFVGQEPHGIAVDNHRDLVYIANHLGGNVSVLDGSTGAVVRVLSLGHASGGNGVALDPVAGLLYVANKFTGDVSRVLVEDGQPPASTAAGAQPDGVAVDPATGIVYVANFGSNTITLLDGVTGTVRRTAPAGGEPAFIALDPARGRFYVTHHLDATVGSYDLATGDLLGTLPTGGGPYGIALDAGRGLLYTADRDGRSVTIVDVTAGAVVKNMPLSCTPYQVIVNPASGHLFVVCADDQQLHIYDRETTLWLAWVPVGRGATEGIAVDPASGRVYVSNRDDDTVTVIQDSGPVITPTPLPTRAPTSTPTVTRTPSSTPTRTATPFLSPTPSATATTTATPTATATATVTPTATASPSPAATRSPTTGMITATATRTPTPTATAVLPGKPDRYEPDDTPAQAQPLEVGAAAQEHTLNRPGDVDWVQFSADAGVRYLFQAAGVNGIELALTLYAADGVTPLASAPAPLLAQADFAQADLAQAGLRPSRVPTPTPTPAQAGLRPSRVPTPAQAGLRPSQLDSSTTSLLWRAPVAGSYYLRVSEREGRGGAGAFYTLGAEALPHGNYLPLVAQGVFAAAASGSVRDRPEREGAGSVGDRPERAGDGSIGDRPERAGDDMRYVADGDRVVALDNATSQVRAVAAGFMQAGGLARAGDRLFVADTLAGTVRVLAADDLRPLADIPVGPGPYAVAVLPATGRIFVALTGGTDEVAVLDMAGLRLLGTTHLGGLGYPQSLVADETTGRVYVLYLLSPRYRQIAVLDGVTGAVLEVIPATLDRPLTNAATLALDPVGRRLLVRTSGGSVLDYDLATSAWR